MLVLSLIGVAQKIIGLGVAVQRRVCMSLCLALSVNHQPLQLFAQSSASQSSSLLFYTSLWLLLYSSSSKCQEDTTQE
jgi:hypothetical protein